jgi:hypothetical protein
MIVVKGGTFIKARPTTTRSGRKKTGETPNELRIISILAEASKFPGVRSHQKITPLGAHPPQRPEPGGRSPHGVLGPDAAGWIAVFTEEVASPVTSGSSRSSVPPPKAL